MTMRIFSLAGSVLPAIPFGFMAAALVKPGGARHGNQATERQGFAGTWQVTIFEEAGPPTQGLITFFDNGTMIAAEHPVVTPPGAPSVIFTSALHGAWSITGPDIAAFTCLVLGSDLTGNLYAVVTYRGEMAIDSTGQSLSGEFTATIADSDGQEMAVFPLILKGRRIVAGE
jgi:hypothetical protein